MADPQSLRAVESRAPAVTRAVAVLEELSRSQQPVGLSELARRLGLAKSTVANLATALEATQMVRRVDGRWSLGYKVFELCEWFRSGTDLVTEFNRLASVLPVASAESLQLAMLDELDVVFLARHDGRQPIRLASDLDRRMPAPVTALGRAMLVELPWNECESRLRSTSRIPTSIGRSYMTMDSLREELEATRRRGHGLDEGECVEGISCVGVVIPGQQDPPAAVSAILLSTRATPEHLAALVADLRVLANQLSVFGLRISRTE